ncbi:TonB-dependent receptor, partial [Pseudoalteromonas sp. SIMBA_153]
RLDFGDLFETIDELDIGEPVLRDVIVKSVIPINQKNTLEILLIDTHEDYTRGVTHVFASPNFEDAALQDSEQDSDMYGFTLRSL